MTTTTTLTTEDCLDHRADGTCKGPVEYRFAMSATGRSFPRCDAHFEVALARYEDTMQRYPVLPPSDFDPDYCGERWSEDDAY
jgi:hypothetical protein